MQNVVKRSAVKIQTHLKSSIKSGVEVEVDKKWKSTRRSHKKSTYNTQSQIRQNEYSVC